MQLDTSVLGNLAPQVISGVVLVSMSAIAIHSFLLNNKKSKDLINKEINGKQK
jgi:S-adenosylmethionine/arginine decarboxylase-like enzyme